MLQLTTVTLYLKCKTSQAFGVSSQGPSTMIVLPANATLASVSPCNLEQHLRLSRKLLSAFCQLQ